MQAVITSVASLKRRVLPTSISHPSVGTEGDLAARIEARNSLKSLRLTRAHLKPLVLTMTAMEKWGYITEIPEGQGGARSSEVGSVMKCERCSQPFTVNAEPNQEECVYHWGKLYNKSLNGIFVHRLLGRSGTHSS
jgi:RNA exonuclease 1